MLKYSWLICLGSTALLACGAGGTSLDGGVRCAASQAYDRSTEQCVDLPACVVKPLEIGLTKGPKSPDGWSAWTVDVPQPTADLHAVWGAEDDNAWMVGSGGAILAWQGLAWAPQPSGTTADLNAIWGVNPCLVWAVGQSGALLKWDGNSWTPQTSGTSAALRGIWGSDAFDVWAVGDGGTLLYFDGTSWSAHASGTTGNLLGIWGSDRNNVWAVGQDGLLLHFDGARWTEKSSGTTQTLHGIWGADADHVWAVGKVGTLLKFDGSTWRSVFLTSALDIFSIHGLSPERVWAVGADGQVIHLLDSKWPTASSGGKTLLGTWGGRVSSLWAVGPGGRIVAFDSELFSGRTKPAYGPSYLDARAVFGTSTSNVWVTGKRGLVLKWDGKSWKQQRSGTGVSLGGVFGTDANNAWAVGSEVVDGIQDTSFLRWSGSAWSPVSGVEKAFYGGIWGSDPDHIWVAADQMLKWNGSVWTKETAMGATGVFGLDANNVWTLGSTNRGGFPPRPTQLISYWNGSAWSLAYGSSTSEDGYLKGLWASDSTNVWVVGRLSQNGGAPKQVFRLSGGSLTPVSTPVAQDLRAIHGSDANNIFAAGLMGTLLRWDGTQFLSQNISGYAGDLHAVWTANALNAWAVGDGVILQHE